MFLDTGIVGGIWAVEFSANQLFDVTAKSISERQDVLLEQPLSKLKHGHVGVGLKLTDRT